VPAGKKFFKKINFEPISRKFCTPEGDITTQFPGDFERIYLNVAYTTHFFNFGLRAVKSQRNMASSSKHPRRARFTVEEALAMLGEEEDHLGMSSDEESEIDRAFDYGSDSSR